MKKTDILWDRMSVFLTNEAYVFVNLGCSAFLDLLLTGLILHIHTHPR
jgi:hypothetical protein